MGKRGLQALVRPRKRARLATSTSTADPAEDDHEEAEHQQWLYPERVPRFRNVRQRERWLQRNAPFEDRRGRHLRGTLQERQESMRERQEQGRYDPTIRRGRQCDCRPDPLTGDLPRMVPTGEDRRSNQGPSGYCCAGCGLVLDNGYLVWEYRATAEERDRRGTQDPQLSQYDVDATDFRVSLPYNRNVHFAEFMALVTLRGPAIPDADMDQIVRGFLAWCDARGKPRDFDAIDMSFGDINDLLRFMTRRRFFTAKQQRCYNERWLQIQRRLTGEYYFDQYGPRILPLELAAEMKDRFRYFNMHYQRLKQQDHVLFRGRKNVPYLMTVARHLLWQTCVARGRRLGHSGMDEYREYEWYYRPLRTPEACLLTEIRTGHIIELLREQYVTGHVLYWDEYRPLLPADLQALLCFSRETKWQALLHRVVRKLLS